MDKFIGYVEGMANDLRLQVRGNFRLTERTIFGAYTFVPFKSLEIAIQMGVNLAAPMMGPRRSKVAVIASQESYTPYSDMLRTLEFYDELSVWFRLIPYSQKAIAEARAFLDTKMD